MDAGHPWIAGVGPTMSSWARGRRFVEPKAAPVYALTAALGALVLVAVALWGFDYDPGFARGYASAATMVVLIAMAARWSGFGRLAGVLEALILLLTLSVLTALCAFVLASADRPCIDDLLAHADSELFGFSRSSIVGMPRDWPRIYAAFLYCYNSLSPQPFVLIAILFWQRSEDAAWTVLLAWGLALLGCLLVSPFAPAHGTPPYALAWIEVFDGARSGQLRTLDGSVLTGIITFPSFHAAGAAVLAWGYNGVRHLRTPMIALNLLVIVSAVLVGGHYIVDVVAGMGIAVIAIKGARAIYRRRPEPDRSRRSSLAG